MKPTVLLVEDSLMNTDLYQAFLMDEPIELISVADGTTALEAVLEKNERRLFTFSEKSAIVF